MKPKVVINETNIQPPPGRSGISIFAKWIAKAELAKRAKEANESNNPETQKKEAG